MILNEFRRSEKDKLDIQYGISKDIDFVAASFVNNRWDF